MCIVTNSERMAWTRPAPRPAASNQPQEAQHAPSMEEERQRRRGEQTDGHGQHLPQHAPADGGTASTQPARLLNLPHLSGQPQPMPRRRPSSYLPAIPPTRSTPPARRHQRPAVQMETDRQTGARREGEEGDKAREKEKRKNGQRHAVKVIYTEPRPICHQEEPPALPPSSRVRLSPSRCRLPCCRRCNSAFGEFAEPGRIFARLQTGEPRPASALPTSDRGSLYIFKLPANPTD